LDAANFGRIAGDLRMSSADLEALVRQGTHAANELPKMLTALSIDQDDLARTEPLVLRDMERVCALCARSVGAIAISWPAPPPRIIRRRSYDRWPRPTVEPVRLVARLLAEPRTGISP